MRRRCASIAARAPSTSSRDARPHAPDPDALDDDLDRRDVEAGQPRHLVRDLRANRRGDLGEVEAVLDDDVQLDPQAARVAFDGDALAAEEPADAAAGRQPDDPVAAERRFGDDLGERVARDGESAELEVQRQVVRHGTALDPSGGRAGVA